jgi:hypothetical protein
LHLRHHDGNHFTFIRKIGEADQEMASEGVGQ